MDWPIDWSLLVLKLEDSKNTQFSAKIFWLTPEFYPHTPWGKRIYKPHFKKSWIFIQQKGCINQVSLGYVVDTIQRHSLHEQRFKGSEKSYIEFRLTLFILVLSLMHDQFFFF